MFYIMGGNKVAPPQAKKTGGALPNPGGKTYSGKPSANGAGSGIGGGTGPPQQRKFAGSGGAGGADPAEMKALEDQVNELKMNNDTLDREREFYFGKLRDIEEMLQKRGLD